MPKLFGKVFKVIWSSGTFGVNKKLKITTKQGVCGKAYEAGNAVVAHEFVNQALNFNLNKNQLKLTSHLKMVASFRIMDDSDTVNKKSDKVIGVLNLESDTIGSENLVINQSKFGELVGEMVSFSLICSKFV